MEQSKQMVVRQMAPKDYIRKYREQGLWSVEILTLLYMVFTTILILIHWEGLSDPMGMIRTRVGMLVAMAVAYTIYTLYPCRALRILRFFPPLLGLISWYPETYDFCSQYPYLDHFFAGIDQRLFGCQPALVFNTLMPSTFWSEAFNLGYYAYYYMMVATLLFYLLCRYTSADRAGFIFLASFFLYYIIYEFLPVAGPQYYFMAVGTEVANTGTFPEVGYYFQTNTEMIAPEIKGIFSQLVQGAQDVGERPTAAFPSSHVGMSTVTMMLAWQTRNRWLFWLMMPLYLLLCCATVYIQAHYLIDSIFGLISAILFFALTSSLYDRCLTPLFHPNKQPLRPLPHISFVSQKTDDMTIIYPSPIFGPVHSRRLGVSLGINLLPSDGKCCSFDCIYCECGFNRDFIPRQKMPTREDVRKALEAQLQKMQQEGPAPDVFTFAGNGEPTLHPQFPEIIDDTLALRDHYFPCAKVSVLTNATQILRQPVFDALCKVDNNICKLDTISAPYIHLVDRPTAAYDVDKIISRLKEFGNRCVIQTMFMKGEYEGKSVDNTTEEYLSPWLATIADIRPREVMIYTIDRETPTAGLSKATPSELDAIAGRVRQLGIVCKVAY